MEVKFYSYSKSGDKTYFKSDLVKNNNIYYFIDKENNKMELSILSNKHVILKRDGNVKQTLTFKENLKETSIYQSLELDLKLEIYTKKIDIKDNSISIEYDSFYEDYLTDSFKIVLLFK